jgi:HSP20 family protein
VARIYFERRGGGEDVGRLLTWLEESPGAAGTAGPECRPPLDVFETAESLEIVADLPGVAIEAIRVLFTQNAVLILGHKAAPACQGDVAFHLAERTFGRFACLVRLVTAVDAGRARATLRAGELLVSLPRIEDRRGRDIEIKVESI